MITEKELGDVRTVKARLVVRGFEEETPVQSVHKERAFDYSLLQLLHLAMIYIL